MRRVVRTLGTLLMLLGVGAIAWAGLVWQWQDPFTALLNRWEQRELAQALDRRIHDAAPVLASRSTAPADLRRAARAWRGASKRGDAIGRLRIPRLGLDVVIVNGTDPGSLKQGPGRYLGSGMPGERRLVYIAGHRTTYGAPFSQIDRLRKGDRVEVELPYATFTYEITGHRIVRATETSVLKGRPGVEQLALQACHPRFFASHRILAYAKPVDVVPAAADDDGAVAAAEAP